MASRRDRAGRRPGYWGHWFWDHPGAGGEAPNGSPFEGLRLAASTRPGSLGDRVFPSQPGTTLASMAMPQEGASSTPLLDDWIAKAGEAAVSAEVEETRRRIDEGSLPSFDNPSALFAFVMRGRQQSA